MPAQELREYQRRVITRIFDAFRGGARSVLVVSPTGSGKTTIFSWILTKVVAFGLVLVHRRELAGQAASRLREFGVNFGLIMAGAKPRPAARVQIASVQTLVRRLAPKARIVVCDEAHLSTAATWARILANYPDARILGFTATPWRLSGKPLAGAYDACVVAATPRDLREQGFLCDYVGFSYLAPDLSKVKTVAGEYNEKQSAAAMRQPQIVANIVEKWLAHASHLSTVVFAVTVEHSQGLAAEFRAAGVTAEHLDGQTSLEQRRAILKRVETGATRVLCNVGVAVEGLDIPRLKCCVDACPTKSLARAIQKWGRVRRPWNGQVARIHDHAFNIRLHGLPDADRDYTLDAKPEKPPSLTTCSECFALYSGAVCPSCAHENEPKPLGERELVTVDDAEQFEFSSGAETDTPARAHNPDALPPVAVTWENTGRVIEGVFEGVIEEPTAWGTRKRYTVRGVKRRYTFPGTKALDARMQAVRTGDQVRVTQTGETPLFGGLRRKEFTVEVDE